MVPTGKISHKNQDHMVRTYGINKVNPYGKTYVLNEYDAVVDDFKHLRANESFRKLHIFHAKRLGIEKFVMLAKIAQQEGKNPARYFSWLLKNSEKSLALRDARNV